MSLIQSNVSSVLLQKMVPSLTLAMEDITSYMVIPMILMELLNRGDGIWNEGPTLDWKG